MRSPVSGRDVRIYAFPNAESSAITHGSVIIRLTQLLGGLIHTMAVGSCVPRVLGSLSSEAVKMKRFIRGVVVGAIIWGGFSSPAIAVSLENLSINGFLDLEYEKADGPGHTTTPVGDENGSFDQNHFNLLMEFAVSDTVTVKGHVEYEHGPQLPAQGAIQVEWSYVEYLVSNHMTLRGGLALTPFGIYNEIHDATPSYIPIQIPWEIYRTTSVGGHAMFPKFSTGLFALGRNVLPAGIGLNYVAYVANGENNTKNEAEKDENSSKAIGGQVMISPLDGVTVGGSYYQGEKQMAPTIGQDHVAWAGSLDLGLHPIGVRAEYASSHLGSVTQNGWYGELSASVKRLTPYVRYGGFDPDQNAGDDGWRALISGLNFRVQPSVVLKVEHRHFSGEPSNTKVNQDYNEAAGAIAVAF